MAPKRSRAPKTAAESAAPPTVPNASVSSPPPATDLHADVIRMKEKITAPFMIYDSAARRIVPNSTYDRTFLTEVRRLQSIPLTKLRTPLQANASYTPKELLYELEAALYCLCASAAVTADGDALNYFTNDAEADVSMPQLESFLAHHSAPAKSTVVLAYCLTEGSSHDILTSYVSMLQQRVEQELNPDIDRRRTEAEHKALRSTKNNLQDIAQLLRDVATAYHCIDTPSQAQRRQPQSDATLVDVARSPAANAVPAQMVHEAFYKVLRWVMAVDTDRRALKIAASVSTASGAATAAAAATSADAAVAAAVAAVASTGADGESASTAPAATAAATTTAFATVVDYDPFTGHVTLERASPSQKWGLLLNPKGLLVGLENDLRNSSAAGERLYDAVQQQSGVAGGLAIYEVNRRRLRPAHLPDAALEDAEKSAALLSKLRDALTQPSIKTLHLSLEKRRQADLTAPQEVLYEVSYQGGESGVGQRVLLMLERASPSIPWGMKLKYLKGAPAVLSDFASTVRLSAAAKDFLFDMRGRVRVTKMNNKDLAKLSAAEMKELVSGALVLTMQLQVTDAKGEVPVGDLVEAEEHVEAQQPEQELEAVETDKAGTQEEEKAEEEDVATAEVEVPSLEHQALDDIAASIADDFLHQQDRTVAAAAAVAATATAALEGEEEDEGKGGDGAFEEYDWANPSAKQVEADEPEEATKALDADAQLEEGEGEAADKMDADGNAHADDVDGADDAKPVVEVDDHEAERELLKRFHLLPDQEALDDAAAGAEEPTEALEKPTKGKRGNAAKLSASAAKKNKKMKGKKGKKAASASAPRGGKTKTAAAAATEEEEEEYGSDEKEGEAAVEEGEEEHVKAVEGPEEDEIAAELPKEAANAEELPEASAAIEEEDEAPTSKSRKEKQSKKTKAGKKGVEKPKRKKGSRSTAAVSADDATDTAPATTPDDDGEERETHEEPEKSLEADKDATIPPQAVAAEVPLVDLPPTTAELAMEAGSKNKKEKGKEKKEKRSSATKTAAADNAKGEEGVEENTESTAADTKADSPSADVEAGASRRVSITELVQAAPLTFENDVQLKKFDGAQLELERGSVANPWNIKVAFAGDDIIMTKLPPIPRGELQHPFLRSLGAGSQGEVKWLVEGLNGQDLSAMSKALKAKALDAIKGSTKLTFALKALRK